MKKSKDLRKYRYKKSQILKKRKKKQMFDEAKKELSFSSTIETNAYSFSSVNKEISQSFLVSGSYEIAPEYVLSGVLYLTKDYKNEREALLQDSALALTKSIGTYGILSSSLGGNLILPTSKASTKYAGLRGGISLTPSFTIAANKFTNISLLPIFTVYSHKYKTQRSGVMNSNYSIIPRLIASFSIPYLEELSLSLDNRYIKAWDYSGNANDIYVFTQSIGYSVTKKLSLGLGHSLGKPVLAANGRDADFKVFDERSSNYFLNIGYKL